MSPGQVEKDLTGSPKQSGTGKTSVLPACWRQGPRPPCPWWEGEPVHMQLHHRGQQGPQGVPLSQLSPTLPRPLGCCSFPRQTGHNRPAGKEKHRLEDLLHIALTAHGKWEPGQHCCGCSLGLEPVDTDQQSTSMFLAVGPRGTPVLCCVRLDNLILY